MRKFSMTGKNVCLSKIFVRSSITFRFFSSISSPSMLIALVNSVCLICSAFDRSVDMIRRTESFFKSSSSIVSSFFISCSALSTHFWRSDRFFSAISCKSSIV